MYAALRLSSFWHWTRIHFKRGSVPMSVCACEWWKTWQNLFFIHRCVSPTACLVVGSLRNSSLPGAEAKTREKKKRNKLKRFGKVFQLHLHPQHGLPGSECGSEAKKKERCATRPSGWRTFPGKKEAVFSCTIFFCSPIPELLVAVGPSAQDTGCSRFGAVWIFGRAILLCSRVAESSLLCGTSACLCLSACSGLLIRCFREL